MSWLTTLQQHLDLIPSIVSGVKSLQGIGHTKESAVQNMIKIVEAAAKVGEVVPVPQVQAISTLVEAVAEAVFSPTGTISIPPSAFFATAPPAVPPVPVGPTAP